MSKQLERQENDGGFIPEGRETYPNLYIDRQLMSELAEVYWDRTGDKWELRYARPNTWIDEKIEEYEEFLKRPHNLPNHATRAKLILTHLCFE